MSTFVITIEVFEDDVTKLVLLLSTKHKNYRLLEGRVDDFDYEYFLSFFEDLINEAIYLKNQTGIRFIFSENVFEYILNNYDKDEEEFKKYIRSLVNI